MKRFAIIICSLLITGCSVAQQYSTESKKAAKYYETAHEHFRANRMDEAEEALLKAVKADNRFLEAYQALAQICLDNGRNLEAIDYYSEAMRIAPESNPDGYMIIASVAFGEGQYDRADTLIDRFLEFSPEKVRNYQGGEDLKGRIAFARNAIANPVPFHPENLGDSVNSELFEYWPSLSVDEQVLYFTVLLTPQPDIIHEDFFYSSREGELWRKRQNVGPPINTNDNEGAQTITADGKVLYFTACNRMDGKGKCDLYRSTLKDGRWSIPVNLGSPINTRHSEKHPAISADGRKLYFSSDRPGGEGGYDIWLSEWKEGKWSSPVNLGDSVNTSGLEQSPFIHPDQQSLYYSSNGWPGMGHGDLFITRLMAGNNWSTPENLGFPINTHNDEVGLIVNAKGNRAYFSSDRREGTDTDIFTFELPEQFRPVLVSYMTGRVYNANNMKGLDAVIQLIDLKSEEVVMELESSRGEGDFLVSLPTDRDYALNVSKPGYIFYSDHFSFSGEHSKTDPFRKDVPLQPLKIGKSVVLNNIFFDHNSSDLLPESLAELNKLLEFMNLNSGIKIEISGHTDNTGESVYNQELSEKRAMTVVNYLVNAGIDESRMIHKGYGEEKPVGNNESDEGRALNRRTELTVTGL